LVRLRAKRNWIPKKKFRRLFENLITTLSKETNARIIVLPINLADDRIEKVLPGTRDNHFKYNEIMYSVLNKYPNHFFIDDLNLTSDEDYPDGVHFSAKGHEIIANRIFNIIKILVKDKAG
jgi:lysophospholipase L1-like esterase